ncbi:MAG: gamma-glutamyltransferase family protein [Dehalococcoidia bacterium]
MDAAIAVNAMLGLVEPVGGGIGGDLFAIVWDPRERKLAGLNASGPSPRELSAERLQEQLKGRTELPLWGALPVTVPGTVDGWFELHRRYGKLTMKQILAPAIRYAREGFPVANDVAFYLDLCSRRYLADKASIEEFDNFRSTYMPDGRVPRAGERFRNPDLAKTYEQLARGGRDAFYRGPIADTIDQYMRRIGGFLRKEDLLGYRADWVEPLGTRYRGYDVFELPPNTQGITALQMLNILQHFDLRASGPQTPITLHRIVEAKRLAFRDRARAIGDPRFGGASLDELLSEGYAQQLATRIRDDARLDLGTPTPVSRGGDTVYLATADANGMMVSLIQSNYQGMGSGLVPDGLGFVLQDRGALFDATPGRVNSYAPGKRPFHTIMPGFVMRDGQPYLAFGIVGGDMQPQAHVQVLTNLIDFDMNVQEAGDAARVYHTGDPEPTGRHSAGGEVMMVEKGLPAATLEGLRERGHVVKDGVRVFGAYQGILYDPVQRAYQAGSDSRVDGQAIGY